MKSLLLIAFSIVTACSGGGSGDTCPDAGPACGSACAASFTGNFADDSSSATNCAMLGAGSGSAATDTVLVLDVTTTDLDQPLAVTIDLGSSPSPGPASSETSSAWSAVGLRATGGAACVYSAGSTAVPTGSFVMTLSAIDVAAGTAHGELVITQYVQAQETVDCGPGDNERVDVRF